MQTEPITLMEVVDKGTTLTLAVFFIIQGAKVVERLLSTLDNITEKCMKMHDETSERKRDPE